MNREAKLAEAATDLLDEAQAKFYGEGQYKVRKPLDEQVLDQHILRAEGYVLELKALREDWPKLSAESKAAIYQYMQRSQR